MSESTAAPEIVVCGASPAALAAALVLADRGRRVLLVSAAPPERILPTWTDGALDWDDPLDAGGGAFGRRLAAARPRARRLLERIGLPVERGEEGSVRLLAGPGDEPRRFALAGADPESLVARRLARQLAIPARDGQLRRMDHHLPVAFVSDDEGQLLGIVLLDLRGGGLEAVPASLALVADGDPFAALAAPHPAPSAPGAALSAAVASGAAWQAEGALLVQPVALRAPEGDRPLPTVVGLLGAGFVEERPVVADAAEGEPTPESVPDVGVSAEGEAPPVVPALPEASPARRRLVFPRSAALAPFAEAIRRRFGIDPRETPLAVTPAVRGFAGGVRVDDRGESSISGLFAVGEGVAGFAADARLPGPSLVASIAAGLAVGEEMARFGAAAVDPADERLEAAREREAARVDRWATEARPGEVARLFGRLADAVRAHEVDGRPGEEPAAVLEAIAALGSGEPSIPEGRRLPVDEVALRARAEGIAALEQARRTVGIPRRGGAIAGDDSFGSFPGGAR